MKVTWRSLWLNLSEGGIVSAVFDHARNLVVATLIVAAGADALKNPESSVFLGVLNIQFAGYLIAAVGVFLIVLNLIDGLNKLSRVRWPIGWQIFLAVVYLFFSLRMAQMMMAFRGVSIG
jgi:hypothetical protein